MRDVEMSKGLRSRLRKFFHFSYHHYSIRDLIVAIKEEGLVDWNNDADTQVIAELSWAYECLQNVASDAFGKHFMAEMDKMNSLTTD